MRLNNAESCVVSVFMCWEGFLTNLRLKRVGRELSWPDREAISLGDKISIDDLVQLDERKQYSFQIGEDGSLVRLQYFFSSDGKRVLSASLGFYKAPEDLSEEVAWLRIDFDHALDVPPLHAACHLHSSMSPSMRIPVSAVPGPYQFVDMIVAWFYPDRHRYFSRVTSEGLRTPGCKNLTAYTRLKIPGS